MTEAASPSELTETTVSSSTETTDSSLNESQLAAAQSPGPVLALAGAGTGKTSMLVARVERLVREGVPSERILAVTFTVKAGRELKSRVTTKLQKRKKVSPLDPKIKLEVGTFHAVSLKFLREMPELAGLKKGFNVADEAECIKICKEILVPYEEELADVSPETDLGKRPGKWLP